MWRMWRWTLWGGTSRDSGAVAWQMHGENGPRRPDDASLRCSSRWGINRGLPLVKSADRTCCARHEIFGPGKKVELVDESEVSVDLSIKISQPRGLTGDESSLLSGFDVEELEDLDFRP